MEVSWKEIPLMAISFDMGPPETWGSTDYIKRVAEHILRVEGVEKRSDPFQSAH